MNVAVIGASDNPEKYSYKALKLLQENGHEVFPVHPRIKSIDGTPVYPSIKDIPAPIHTVSLYVSTDVSKSLTPDILSVTPKRLIFNPGAENPELFSLAQSQGIECLNACTLVLLKTKKF